jgi:hypothetical protein
LEIVKRECIERGGRIGGRARLEFSQGGQPPQNVAHRYTLQPSAMPPPDRPFPSKVTNQQVQALLTRHACPTPLHVLRMRFLGAIASPRFDVSPIKVIEQAWGGELPEFASQDELEELMQTLVSGLWNRLSEHQNSRTPFRLPRTEVKPTRQAILALTEIRSQELAGFVDGLFGDDEEMDLPEKAHEALNQLAEMHSMFAGGVELLADENTPAHKGELADLLRNFQKVTIAADDAINRIIQSCKRARAHQMNLHSSTFVTARRFTAGPEKDEPDSEEEWEDGEEGEYTLTYSPLNQTLTRNGVTVEVHIYKGHGSNWILELVDAAGNSHVWDDQFETDEAAFTEAMRALDEEPLEFMEPQSGSNLN